jgi:hypothetical protein
MFFFILFVFNTFAFVQQGNKHVVTNAVAEQGSSVSINNKYVLIGGPAYDSNIGAVWMFAGDNEVQKLTFVNGSGEIGASVSQSSENYAIVGAPQDNYGAGAAFIFSTGVGNVLTQTDKIIPIGADSTAHVGSAVAITENYALIGASNDGGGVGAIWFYGRVGNSWSVIGGKRVPATVFLSRIGCAVAMNDEFAIVGGSDHDSQTGSVWLYRQDAGEWTEFLRREPVSFTGNPLFGFSVAISPNYAIVGATTSVDYGGLANILTRGVDNTWSRGSIFLTVDECYDVNVNQCRFGSSVAINDEFALVGGPNYESNVGGVWMFQRFATEWALRMPKLIGPQTTSGFGSALALYGDYAVIGGPKDNSNVGAIWLFYKAPNKDSGATETFKPHMWVVFLSIISLLW